MAELIHQYILIAALSCLLLIGTISAAMYMYIREKAFRQYSFFALLLAIYLLSKNFELLDYIQSTYGQSSFIVLTPLNWTIQVWYYSFYYWFAVYFFDVQRTAPRLSNRLRIAFKINLILVSVFFILSLLFPGYKLAFKYFAYVFLPFIFLCTGILIPRIVVSKADYKFIFLTGVFFFIALALNAFIGFYTTTSIYRIDFFVLGVIIENLLFGVSLVMKFRKVHRERETSLLQLLQADTQHKLEVLQAMNNTETKERQRIAENLHDGIGGSLAGLKHYFTGIMYKSSPSHQSPLMQSAIAAIDEVYEEVRRLSHHMMPRNLEELGLIKALELYCQNLSADTKVIFINTNLVDGFGAERDLAIYRIIQELLNNALKHSHATRISVEISTDSENCEVIVADDGVGFDPDVEYKEGMGMTNIQKRVSYLSAVLDIISAPKQGTKVSIRFPI